MKEKHKEFADEYLANGYNAQKAYVKVYQCSQSNGNMNAYRVLNREDVQQYIKEMREQLFKSRMVDAYRWVDETASIAFAPKGDEVYTTSDKLKALQMIQKYLGLDVQKVDQKTEEIIEVSLVED